MLHTFLDNTIYFDIIYKNRKTIGITIDSYGQIQVIAPKKTEIKVITDTIEKHWEHILTKLEEVNNIRENIGSKTYDSGEEFLYLGKKYPIYIMDNNKDVKDYVKIENNQMNIYVKDNKEEAIKQALKRFFYQKTKALVEERVRLYQPNFNQKVRGIKIVDDNKNWGTCNGKFELTFNWKLSMVQIEAIDYVVVHEMCHMVHLNHDRSFWRLVGKMLPDYEDRRNRLNSSLRKLNLDSAF